MDRINGNSCDIEAVDASGDIGVKTRYQTSQKRDVGYHGTNSPRESGINCEESLYSRRMESSQATNENHDFDTVMHGVETLLKEMRDSRHDNRVYENMPNTKKTKVMPDHFDGKSSWSEYLIHFETVAELNGWNPHERVKYLAVSLRGEACLVMQSLGPEERRTYHAFVESLSKRFNPGNRVNLYRTQLRTKARRDKETLPQLAQSIRTMAARAYPRAERERFESLCCDHFLDATGDPELWNMLCLTQPQRFDDLVNMAVQLEANRQADRQRQPMTKRYIREISKASSTETPSLTEKDATQSCNFIGKTKGESNLEELIEKLMKLMEELKISKQYKAKHETDLSKIKCFNCGEFGHFKSKCPQSEQSNEAIRNHSHSKSN